MSSWGVIDFVSYHPNTDSQEATMNAEDNAAAAKVYALTGWVFTGTAAAIAAKYYALTGRIL